MDAIQPPAFADLLRRYRRAAGLTQEELAERARISVRAVSDLERGLSRRPRHETLQLLATALHLSAQDRAAFMHAARVRVPPALPTRDRPGHLPTSLTSFIGRAPELAALRRLLTRERVRLVTLAGAPGIGKTRLGVQLAAALQDQFADGVAFVPLAAIQEPTLVAAAIARALGLPESAEQPTPARLGQSLRRKELLLVLDNFEQVLAAAPLLADLLQAAPGLTLLVTSRAVLHLSGEQEFPVPPLPLPEMQMPLVALAENEAVRLFVARAQAVKPDFQLTAANGVDVAAICFRLDGLPLAIELAARRSRLLTPEALLGRLEHRLGVLTGGARDLPPRQQTLRATIDWSYHLLRDAEQRLFTRLAAFAGGWTIDAAEAVCNAHGDLGCDVLDGLQSLVDQSLVHQAPDGDGAPRFRLLEMLREYAQERLAAGGDAARVRHQHAAYYLALAEAAPSGWYGGPTQHGWFARLEREHDNLRAALRWAQEQAAADLGWRLCQALFVFWGRRGYWSDAQYWIDAMVALPEACKAQVPVTVRREVLLFAAAQARLAGDAGGEQAYLAECRAICQAAGDRVGLGQVFLHLEERDTDPGRCQALLDDSLALFQAAGDSRWSAVAVYRLGCLARWRGDHARARAYLALTREIEDPQQRAAVLLRIGGQEREGGEVGLARAMLTESLRIFRELPDPTGTAEALNELGATERDAGNYAQARALLGESVKLFRALRVKENLAGALLNLGETLLQVDDQPARALLEESVALFRELEYPLGSAWPLILLGHLAKHRGNAVQADAFLRESLVIVRDWGHRWGIPLCLAGLGGVATQQGHLERAARLFGAAEALFAATLAPPLAHRIERERDLATARAHLDTVRWEAAWTEGRAMSQEQAIAYALGDEILPGRAGPRDVQSVSTAVTPSSCPDGAPVALTPRELEVLQLVAQGYTDQAVATRLGLRPRTGSSYLSAIYGKLGVRTRTAAAHWLLDGAPPRLRWPSPPPRADHAVLGRPTLPTRGRGSDTTLILR